MSDKQLLVWQPIDEAPINRLILAWMDGYEQHSGMETKWKRCGYALIVMHSNGVSEDSLSRAINRIMGDDDSNSSYRLLEPTHFQLLPAPPEEM